MNIFKLLRNYFLLLKSDLFDSKYYLKENPDVKKAKINPIFHYLTIGWKEGRNPSPFFNTNNYLKIRPDVKNLDVCPLVHYELCKKELFSMFLDKLKDLNELSKVFFVYKRGINKEKLSYEMENYFESSELGITDEKREPELIVSLTSYPDRMYDIHYTIYSLFKQNLKPNKIILWLGEEQFPNRDKDLSKKLLDFKKHGLIIKYTNDLRAYTKLIPALKEYPNSIIVTADDDIFYPENWLDKLYNSWKDNMDCIVCHRAHKITIKDNKFIPYNSFKQEIIEEKPSFDHFLTGVGGVLYPPNIFYKDIFNEELFKKLSPQNDDIWFWAMAVLNGTKIKIVDEPINHLTYVNPEREVGLNNDSTLCSSNVIKNQNDILFDNVINYYPHIMEKLLSE